MSEQEKYDRLQAQVAETHRMVSDIYAALGLNKTVQIKEGPGLQQVSKSERMKQLMGNIRMQGVKKIADHGKKANKRKSA